jgi:hypothetical protein
VLQVRLGPLVVLQPQEQGLRLLVLHRDQRHDRRPDQRRHRLLELGRLAARHVHDQPVLAEVRQRRSRHYPWHPQ